MGESREGPLPELAAELSTILHLLKLKCLSLCDLIVEQRLEEAFGVTSLDPLAFVGEFLRTILLVLLGSLDHTQDLLEIANGVAQDELVGPA